MVHWGSVHASKKAVSLPTRQTRQKCVSLREAQTRQKRPKRQKVGVRRMQASLSHLLLLATPGLAVRLSPGCGAEIPHQPHPGWSIFKKAKTSNTIPKVWQNYTNHIHLGLFGHHSCWEGFKSIYSHLLLWYVLFIYMNIGPGGSHNKQVELVDPVMGEVISAT